MAGYTIGSSGGDFDDTIRRAQAAASAQDELNRKERARRDAEEQAASAEGASTRIRTGLVGATNELSSALTASESAIASETAALEANTRVLERNRNLRREIAGLGPLVGAAGGGGGGGRVTPVATAGGFEEDPGAQARLQAALAAQAAAEQRQKASAAAYTTALRPGATVAPEDASLLLQQREEAAQQVRVAKAETAAAQANVAAQQQLAREREVARSEQAQINAALQAERAAIQRATAEANAAAAARAESAVSARQLPQLGAGRTPLLLSEGGQFQLPPARAINTFPPTIGGPASSAASGDEALHAHRQNVVANYEALDGLAGKQREVNQAFQEAGAIYASSSNALSRHGALTTEFIQAFARGEVTLKEFESQMLSTIGKFGGWALAGAAVYGVFDLFKHLTAGATETQNAVQQLGRFIPGLGGPAGGGSGLVGYAQSTVRDISTQFNVPISEVVSSMQVMARTFHSVADAGDATRAVLAVSRLDQVSPQQSEQYLTGISNSLGLRSGGQLLGVVNSLNALQSQLGARVSQTLPALARAAPAAIAAGLDTPTLEALVALGVRSGITGPQVGTALLRSAGTFAFRPQSQLTFEEYGIHPVAGEYGNLVRDVTSLIDRRAQAGRPLSGTDLGALARALGGPLLGTRTILPILEQEAQHPGRPGEPGALQRAIDITQHPRNYQEDLDQVLGSITERFKSIGIGLENFGSRLASSGALTPIIALFDAFGLLLHATEALVSPITDTLSLFNQLPGAVRDVLGALIGLRVARYAYGGAFGTTAQSLASRLPGLQGLRDPDRELVAQATGQIKTVLPDAKAQADSDAQRLAALKRQVKGAYDDLALYTERAAPPAGLAAEDPRVVQFQGGVTDRRQNIADLESKIAPAEQRVAESQAVYSNLSADLVIATDRRLGFAERAASLEQQGYVAQQTLNNLTEELVAVRRAQIRASGIGGGRGGGAAAAEAIGVGGAVAGSAAAVAAASAIARDQGAMSDIAAGVQSSGAVPPPIPPVFGAPTSTERPAAEGGVRPSVAPPGFVPAEAAAAAGRGTILEQLGLAGAVSGVQSRYGSIRDAIDEAGGVGAYSRAGLDAGLQRARAARADLAAGAPLAGLLGTQIIGSTIGGDAGNYISNVGGTAFSGALIAQMLKRSPLAGLTLGTIAGSFQQSSSSGIGSTIGAGAGAGLGFVLGGPPGALVGATIGSTLGSLVGNIFGGGQSDADKQAQAQAQAQRAIRQAEQNKAGLNAFGDQFAADLASAFEGTGSAAQSAQAKIKTEIDGLTAEVQLFGASSKQGQAAKAALASVISAAVSSAQASPQSAQQIISAATGALNQEVDRQLQYAIATGGPGSGLAASLSAAPQYGQVADAARAAARTSHEDLTGAQQELAALQKRYAEEGPVSGDALVDQIAAAKKRLQGLQDSVGGLDAAARITGQDATLRQQAAAQTAYQADSQGIQAQTALAQANAGGNQIAQLRAQVTGAQQILRRAQSDPNLDPQTQANEVARYQAQLTDLQNKIVTQGLTELQSKGTLAEARVPIGDTGAAAEQKLRDLTDQYNYMRRNARAFDPSQFNDALAAVIQAKKEAADAVGQYQTQLNDLSNRVAQARDVGNAVAQAEDQLRTATRDLKLAVTPSERLAAQASLIEAQNAAYQAITQRADAAAQIAEVNATGDAGFQAAIAQSRARYDLSRARGPEEQNAALLELAQANVQAHQAAVARINALGNLQSAEESGDPVGQARTAVQTARTVLANARGVDEQVQAETQLAQANYALHQALQQRLAAQTDLAASQTREPLQQLSRQISGAVEQLRGAQGPAERTQDQTKLNQLRNQYEGELISQRESTIQFQLSMQEITAQQAINQLNDLLKMKGLTTAERQRLQEELRRIALGQYSTIGGGSGSFDLTPGNVPTPTVYDVHRAMSSAAHRGSVHHTPLVHASAQTEINVYVNNAEDVPKVADALDRATGSHLRARLRAAGIRGN